MTTLPNYLTGIKSAGIYRFVWDKSEITGVSADTLRLVVGYSETGPFNTPVYINTESEFTTTFGSISKKLEKRGVFFHRLALQALAAGPIICLNLKKFENETVEYATINPYDEISGPIAISVEDIYDTNKFWTLEPENLNDVTLEGSKISKYLSIAAADVVGNSNSVFFRGAKVDGYDISVKSWYTQMGIAIPDYLADYQDLLIEDFFATVYVFQGEFTKSVATSSELNSYFDIITDDAGETTVQLKEYYLNAFGEKTDTLTALAADENSNYIGAYTGILLPEFTDSSGNYISLDLTFNDDYNSHKMIMTVNQDLLEDTEAFPITNLDVSGYTKITDELLANIVSGEDLDHDYGMNIMSNKGIIPVAAVSKLVRDENGDVVVAEDGSISFDTTMRSEWSDYDEDISVIEYNADLFNSTNYAQLGLGEGDLFVGENATVSITTIDDDGTYNFSDNILIYSVGGTTDETSTDETSTDETSESSSPTYYIVRCNNILSERINNMSPLYLKGYTFENSKPASTSQADKLAWQDSIISAMIDYSGIRDALTNRVDVDYRYLVDTFESYVDSEVKAKMALIAKEKQNVLALLNFPSVSTFKSCDYTSFTDNDNKFAVKYVVNGGNKAKSLGKKFTLVSEANGASYVSYNTPLIFSDGTVKTTVPAAALVSNQFMNKYKTRLPYYIVAGPNYGLLSYTNLVGPDYKYSRADLDLLEPWGVNATVYVPRKGTYINSNQTAKQTPVTALSKVHVRELVTFIQDEIEKLLESYHWELNTQTLRDNIVAKADTICETVMNNGGIYAYTNSCPDDQVYTDNEMLVLRTAIEPTAGAGKMVQELTIYQKGGISSATVS